MSIRTKTKRRLLIIFGVVVVIVVAVAGTLLIKKQRNERDARANRVLGLEAAKKGEFVEAIDKLRQYLNVYPNDVEALFQIALAREKVEMPGGAHIGAAAERLKHLLEIEPNNRPAQEELLKLFTQMGYGKEASDLADRILADNPNHLEAIRGKAIALLQVRQFDQAVKIVDRGIAIAPNDYGLQRLALELLIRLNKPSEVILARFEEQLKKHPDDPRFLMLMGVTTLRMHDVPKSIEWLKKAAARPLTDPLDVRQLALAMEETGMFSESITLLSDSSSRLKDQNLLNMLIQRLWQSNRDKELLERLKGLDANSREASSDVLAYKAMSLFRIEQRDQMGPLIDALAARNYDNRARAWNAFIRGVIMGEVKEPLAVVEVCRKALTAAPDNACIHYFLGEAYSQLGENEPAIDQWKEAIKYANSWSMPFIRISQTFASSNRGFAALQLAEAAFQRSPGITAAIARATAAAQVPSIVRQEDLLRAITDIQKAVVSEPSTLSIYADLLGLRGQKKEATAAIQGALAVVPAKAAPEQVLIRLAMVSRRHELGLESQCLDFSEKVHGLTATLALTRALQLVADDKSAAALDYMQKAIESKKGQNDLEWKIGWAKLLDVTDDPRAKGVWVSLAESEGKNLNVQRLALEARSVQRDRDFLDRTIDRVKALSFDEGLTWRLARSRWLLGSDKPERDVPKAIVMLTEIVRSSPDLLDPRLVLAAAQERNDNPSAAAEQLAEASRIQPENPAIAVELARIRLLVGNVETAREALKPVMRMQVIPEALRPTVASILAQTGEMDRAIAMLEQTHEPSMMLAELYTRRNDTKKAEGVYQELVAKPDASAIAIRTYAFFLANLGRNDEALTTLGKLQNVSLEPGVLETIRGDYDRRFIGPESAISQYRAALKLAKDNRNVWRTLIGYYFELNRIPEAFQAIAEAKTVMNDDPAVNLIARESDLFHKVAAADHLRPMIQTVLRDRENRDTAVEVLRLMIDAEAKKEAAGSTLIKLRQLADRNVRFMSVQNIVIDLAFAVRQFDVAADVSTRAMSTFRQDPEPAERLTKVFAAQGKYAEALGVAEQWRMRAVNYPMPADVYTAELKLAVAASTVPPSTADANAALARIEPYRSGAMSAPEKYPEVVSIYTRGLVLTGQVEQAAKILKPLIPLTPNWRSQWLTIAMRYIRDKETAVAWMDRVEAVTPPASTVELAYIGNDLHLLGKRFNDAALRERGRDLLRKLAMMPGIDPEIMVAYGQVAYQEGDAVTAMVMYRQALRLKPAHPIAMNNLAVLMNDRGEDPTETENLIRKALELQPDVATYQDTLAQVLMKRHRYDEAIATLKRAVELEPRVVDWKLNLAEAQAIGGKPLDAERSLQSVEAMFSDPSSIPKAVRDRVTKIRGIISQKPAPKASEKQAAAP